MDMFLIGEALRKKLISKTTADQLARDADDKLKAAVPHSSLLGVPIQAAMAGKRVLENIGVMDPSKYAIGVAGEVNMQGPATAGRLNAKKLAGQERKRVSDVSKAVVVKQTSPLRDVVSGRPRKQAKIPAMFASVRNRRQLPVRSRKFRRRPLFWKLAFSQ